MVLKTRVWSAGKILLILVALASTYLVFAVASARIALRVREVAVPDLRGRSLNEATTMLQQLDLTLKVDEAKRPDAKIAPGHITVQEPMASAEVRRGRTVKVWVSAGTSEAKVPKLIGESIRTAELRLQQDGLALASLAEIKSSQYPPDTVVAQEPPPDARATKVSLLVNRGESAAVYLMPDLIGLPGEQSADLLREKGFRVTVTGRQPYPGVPAGIVLRQSPQSGFQVSPGDAISLEVSR